MKDDYEKGPTTTPRDFVKEGEGEANLAPEFVPLASPPVVSSTPPTLKPDLFPGAPKLVKAVANSEVLVLKPRVVPFPVKIPAVKVVSLDALRVYAGKEAVQPVSSLNISGAIAERVLDEMGLIDGEAPLDELKIGVKPRYPSIKPATLDRDKIYRALDSKFEDLEGGLAEPEIDSQEKVEAGFSELKSEYSKGFPSDGETGNVTKIEDSIIDKIELILDKESADRASNIRFETSSEGELKSADKPIIPNPDEVAKLVAEELKSSNNVEVLRPESSKRDELSISEENVSKWAFWKRPSKRDRQLARMSEGYLEMVDLVRSIRGQLDSQSDNNMILRESLVHLPQAIKGLDQGLEQFSKSQQVVGQTLGQIHTQLKFSNEKDDRLSVSMNGMNHTLKGMDDTNKATIETFDRVQERMKDSDLRMEDFFQNVHNTEEKMGETMLRLQRNMAVMHYIFLGCLIAVFGVLVFTVIMKKEEPTPPSQIERVDIKPDSESD